MTEAYAKQKPIPDVAGRKGRVLADIPQLKALFEDAAAKGRRARGVRGDVRRSSGTVAQRRARCPTPDLALAIATAKVRAVEDSIDACWQLKQEVGSYALMGDSGFKHLDFLNCCKFAEGDSRVLAQKMAEDYIRRLAKIGDDGTAASRLAEVRQGARAGRRRQGRDGGPLGRTATTRACLPMPSWTASSPSARRESGRLGG